MHPFGPGYRVKINASPATASPAPSQLFALGLCPVRSHNSGRMITGEVADKVAMIPVCPPCRAKRNSVIPNSSPIPVAAQQVAVPSAASSWIGKTMFFFPASGRTIAIPAASRIDQP